MHGVFKRLDNFAGQRGQASEDVHRAALNAVFVDKRDVAILHLDCDRHQHGVAGDLHEVGAHIERHGIEDHLGVNFFFKIRELHLRSRLQFGVLLQTIKLFGLLTGAVRSLAQAFHSAAGEALRFRRHPHLLVESQARVRSHEQRVFFGAIQSHVVFAAHAVVNELHDDFLTDAVDVAIAPVFKRIGRSLATALFHRTLVASTGGMGIDLIGFAKNDVHASAIGLPARNASRKMFIGVGNALVMLFLIFVLFGVGSGIAALPEGLNKIIAFFVVRKLLERRPLFVGDDPDYVLFQPLFIRTAQFLLEGPLVLLLLSFVGRTFEGICGVGLRRRGGRLLLRWDSLCLRYRRLCWRGAGSVVSGLVGGLLNSLVLSNSANHHHTRRYEQNSEDSLI